MKIETIKELLVKDKSCYFEIYNDFCKLNNTYKIQDQDVIAFEYALTFATDNLELDSHQLLCSMYALVMGYCFTSFYWRAKKYVHQVISLIEQNAHSLKNEMISEMLVELGDYYRMVSNQKEALNCYKKAFEYLKDGDTLFKIVVATKCLDPDYEFKFNEQELQKLYPSDIKRILMATEGKGFLKIDPIENSEEFQSVYNEVHEQMLEILNQEGDLHLAIQKWGILEDLYLKKGIVWKNPKMMNPRVMFD